MLARSTHRLSDQAGVTGEEAGGQAPAWWTPFVSHQSPPLINQGSVTGGSESYSRAVGRWGRERHPHEGRCPCTASQETSVSPPPLMGPWEIAAASCLTPSLTHTLLFSARGHRYPRSCHTDRALSASSREHSCRSCQGALTNCDDDGGPRWRQWPGPSRHKQPSDRKEPICLSGNVLHRRSTYSLLSAGGGTGPKQARERPCVHQRLLVVSDQFVARQW